MTLYKLLDLRIFTLIITLSVVTIIGLVCGTNSLDWKDLFDLSVHLTINVGRRNNPANNYCTKWKDPPSSKKMAKMSSYYIHLLTFSSTKFAIWYQNISKEKKRKIKCCCERPLKTLSWGNWRLIVWILPRSRHIAGKMKMFCEIGVKDKNKSHQCKLALWDTEQMKLDFQIGLESKAGLQIFSILASSWVTCSGNCGYYAAVLCVHFVSANTNCKKQDHKAQTMW